MKAVFDAYDELCHLWGYAEDLETFEHANKLLLSYCASPVSLVTSHLKTSLTICRLRIQILKTM